MNPGAHKFLYGVNAADIAQSHESLKSSILDAYKAEQVNIRAKAQKNKNPRPPSVRTVSDTPAALSVRTASTPRKAVRERDFNAIYEENSDKRLLEQKKTADSRKKEREEKSHKNIVEKEHEAHLNRVKKLSVHEMHHIESIYEELKKKTLLQEGHTPDQYTARLARLDQEKNEMIQDVLLHSATLSSTFRAQEQSHALAFKKIEKSSDAGRKSENKITEKYNQDKVLNYQKAFAFGVKMQNPDISLGLTEDSKQKYFVHQDKEMPLLQYFRHKRGMGL
jgi:hypothetical protein